MSELLYQPSSQQIEQTNIMRFMQFVNRRYQQACADYESLYQWSIEHSEDFWQAIAAFHDVKWHQPCDTVLQHKEDMLTAKWFVGATLNFAENLLGEANDDLAIIETDERGRSQQITFAQLHQQVAAVASFLKAQGVGIGDRVAGLLPNISQTVIAMLACSSLGAIWSSCSPDFGYQGVLDRFGQIEPKILFTVNGYFFKGKQIDIAENIRALQQDLPSLNKTVIIDYLENNQTDFDNSCTWSELENSADQELSFESLPFSHPLYIMYSSGTTGKPKCIVHGAGGTLLQHLKEHALHTDVKPHDRIFFYTTCGWMMWNWLVSALALRATIVLFEGAPLYPDASQLWRMVQEHQVNHFGTSAKYISAVHKENYHPNEQFSLEHLKTLMSTGSPLAPESFDFIQEHINKDLLIASISGGTDIISCFALGCPIRPVYRGQLQCRGLGMAVEIFDEAGHSVQQQQGDLVCIKPFVSQPVGFWQDDDRSKYKSAYFAQFDNVWAHGDYAEITAEDGLIIYGRSDAVLNPGGVRIGTAEIYRQLENMDEIADAIAVGQQWQDDVRVILFVVLQHGAQLDEALQQKIKQRLRTNASPRHVPAKIIAVADIPRTVNGKISELAVKNVIHQKPVKNQHALANPESLKLFENIPQLSIS